MFRVYYGDGSIYEGDRPEDAPTDKDVQAIAWNDPTKGYGDIGRIVLREYDLYIYSDHVGDWHGTDKFSDLMNHLAKGCGAGGVRAVLYGLWIDRAKFKDIVRCAETDEGLNPKNAGDPIREDGSA